MVQADINARLLLSNISSVPQMHGGFLWSSICELYDDCNVLDQLCFN